ncbi:E3 ubiquitin/ISG15 ligase TRIM25-like [Trichomycterus rosablanca]|uniref:E3 ubiquitin/ISG15 ligase TRIM25-like n=1 Tax=Trichomycterus rosablanca TaxID=2290929 RepID=UPI002F3586CA
MAEANISVEEEQFCCSICLDLLNNPVTIPCGHSYCKPCITHFWDQKDMRECHCPQCRKTFTVRPELNRNTVLAELVEKLRNTGFQPSGSRTSNFAPSEGVMCDACSSEKRPAVASCLVCLASYCDVHVKPHYESPAFKKHKLVAACRCLQEKICSAHDRLFEFYCRTDQMCVCCLCTMNDHKNHDTVPAESARAEKAEELFRLDTTLNQMIEQREKESGNLRKAVHCTKRKAHTASDEIKQIFADLLISVQKMRTQVLEQLESQKESELKQAQRLLEKIEVEITDLKKTSTELERMLKTDDHIDFLQSCLSLNYPSELQAVSVFPHGASFECVVQSLSKLQKSLKDVCSTEIKNISETSETHSKSAPIISLLLLIFYVLVVKDARISRSKKARKKTPKPATQPVSIPEPKIREDFLQYACFLTLSAPNHPNLSVCEGNRAVECVALATSVNTWPQVLCRERLTGRSYWEVEWSGKGVFTIGISQAPVLENGFGGDDQSWALDCFQLSYVFRHAGESVPVVAPKLVNRVGIYLDYRGGTLSFYSVTDTMTLLHRVRADFTRPLYPGFALWAYGWQSNTFSHFFNKQSFHSTVESVSVRLVNMWHRH